jgi:hypothetical protein
MEARNYAHRYQHLWHFDKTVGTGRPLQVWVIARHENINMLSTSHLETVTFDRKQNRTLATTGLMKHALARQM